MTANEVETTDFDAILPEPERVEVEGIPVTVRRLKAKEFFALLRVITSGLGSNIGQLSLDGDEEEMKGQIVGLLIAAVPNAAEEFVDFLHLVIDPIDSKQTGALNRAMDNPELETVIDVLTAVAEQEAGDIAALVGKAGAALKKIQSVYQKPTKTGR